MTDQTTLFERCEAADHDGQVIRILQAAAGPYRAVCEGCGQILATAAGMDAFLHDADDAYVLLNELRYEMPVVSLAQLTELGWLRASDHSQDVGTHCQAAETEDIQLVIYEDHLEVYDPVADNEVHLSHAGWDLVRTPQAAARVLSGEVNEPEQDHERDYERACEDDRCHTCGEDDPTRFVYYELCEHTHCLSCGHAIDDEPSLESTLDEIRSATGRLADVALSERTCYVQPELLWDEMPWQHQIELELRQEEWTTIVADEEELVVTASAERPASGSITELAISLDEVTIKDHKSDLAASFSRDEWDAFHSGGEHEPRPWQLAFVEELVDELMTELAQEELGVCDSCGHPVDIDFDQEASTKREPTLFGECPNCGAGWTWPVRCIVSQQRERVMWERAQASTLDMTIECPCGEEVVIRHQYSTDRWEGRCPNDRCRAEFTLTVEMPSF